MKWYQNRTGTEKKNLGESSNGKRKKRVSSESHASTSDDDEEGVELHLKELLKEFKKKSLQDRDKIIRLQNLTATFRLRKIGVSFSYPCTTCNRRVSLSHADRKCKPINLLHVISLIITCACMYTCVLHGDYP